ncbi:hypothetical protein SASPL_139347 [Salvia splendens]|uniref:Uncharacterized protein n=1 Tax=Salvia splendens TaxID=180675 RepID=A0A8X8WMZ4_SALSN|nr:hypothetical protein SASPL_139347 [Salvia splendens]
MPRLRLCWDCITPPPIPPPRRRTRPPHAPPARRAQLPHLLLRRRRGPSGQTHDVTFANRPPGLVPETLLYSLSDIVFSPYGEHRHRLKRICMQGLLSARPVRSFRGIREEENLNLCREIASCERSLVNLTEGIYLAAYDVVARASVKAKTEEWEMMIAVVVKSLRLGSGFMLADLFPSVKFLPLITGAWFKIRRMRRRLDRVLDGIIEQNRAEASDDDDGDGDGHGGARFVDVLLKFEKDGTLTTDLVKALLVDTLATTLKS